MNVPADFQVITFLFHQLPCIVPETDGLIFDGGD